MCWFLLCLLVAAAGTPRLTTKMSAPVHHHVDKAADRFKRLFNGEEVKGKTEKKTSSVATNSNASFVEQLLARRARNRLVRSKVPKAYAKEMHTEFAKPQTNSKPQTAPDKFLQELEKDLSFDEAKFFELFSDRYYHTFKSRAFS
jgi:hypothetical protein